MGRLKLYPTCSTEESGEHVRGREDWVFKEIIDEDFLELIKGINL